MILEPSKHTFNGISYYQNTNTDIAYILVYDQNGHIIVAAKSKYKIRSQNTIFVSDDEMEFFSHLKTQGLFASSKSNIDDELKGLFEL
jgi:hypothetical protein